MTQPIPIRPEVQTPERSNHMASLRRVYDEFGGQLRAVLARLGGPGLDPDDLLHEVFLVAMKRPDVFAEGDARGWLYGVAVNVASAARRRSRLRRFLGLEEAEPIADTATADRNLLANDARRQVYAALEKLSEKKRTVFVLFELEGLTGEEISRTVKIPLKTVWTRLYHARREFLVHLKALEGGRS